MQRQFEVLFVGMQRFGFSFYGVCRMGFTLVPLIYGYVDMRFAYHSDLFLPSSRFFFWIAFPTCFCVAGSLVLQWSFSDLFWIVLGSFYCIFICRLLVSFKSPLGFYFIITLPMVVSFLRNLQKCNLVLYG